MLVCCSIYSRYIEERSFRRFVEACLEETVVVYVDHLLTQVGHFLSHVNMLFHGTNLGNTIPV